MSLAKLPQKRYRCIFLILILIIFDVFLEMATAQAEPHEDPEIQKFLLIYSGSSTLTANVRVTDGLIQTLNPALGLKYELYSEYRDDQRFAGAAEDEDFIREIERKYADIEFDAIFTFGSTAFHLMPAVRDRLFPDAPIIYGGFPRETLAARSPPPKSSGFVSAYSILETFKLARMLQPEATRLILISGSSPFDRSWRERAELDLRNVPGLQAEFLSDLTVQEFREFVGTLDQSSIVIILTIFADRSGQSYIPADAAQMISEASGAPTYTVYETWIGRGVVGGVVASFEEIGAAMAGRALEFLSGAALVASPETLPGHPTVDWRQLQHFGLDAGLVPDGTRLAYHEAPVWEQYTLEIALAAAVILLQSVTIIALVLLEKRRKSAEREASARRVELAHMSRVAQLGELSGALAHELNQPLAAILANAEAGRTLVKHDPPDLQEITEILADIALDDRRAADIIKQLRKLLSKDETDFESLDLNELVASTAQLLNSEMVVRGVGLVLRLIRGGAIVSGSETQLRQVILNLVLNAAEAVADQPSERRDIVITTSIRPDGWREVSVRDRGTGLSPSIASDPFRSFATTKRGGLGLGLSICRSIAQAHAGTLAFDPAIAEGARAVLTLPRP